MGAIRVEKRYERPRKRYIGAENRYAPAPASERTLPFEAVSAEVKGARGKRRKLLDGLAELIETAFG
jgi:hypothetical protein